MRRILFLILIPSLFLFSDTYTFLVEKYDKEVELEAKIISNIANNLIKKELKVFIPKLSQNEKNIYSQYVNLSKECEKSNFVYIRVADDINETCKTKNSIYFTNNYKILLNDKKFIGAFFWNKSRPNVVFFKTRLDKNKISLPKDYIQFLEVNR